MVGFSPGQDEVSLPFYRPRRPGHPICSDWRRGAAGRRFFETDCRRRSRYPARSSHPLPPGMSPPQVIDFFRRPDVVKFDTGKSSGAGAPRLQVTGFRLQRLAFGVPRSARRRRGSVPGNEKPCAHEVHAGPHFSTMFRIDENGGKRQEESAGAALRRSWDGK
jgi:hypothetical protein